MLSKPSRQILTLDKCGKIILIFALFVTFVKLCYDGAAIYRVSKSEYPFNILSIEKKRV